MTKGVAENLLFASLAVNAALLILFAGVFRKVMNEMDEPAFKQFVVSLVHHSKRSPFMIVSLSLPLLGAIPYLYFYGFGNRWLIAGLVVWFAAGSIGKTMKLPIYKAVAALDYRDSEMLREARRKLNAQNLIQAALNSVATVLALVPLVR